MIKARAALFLVFALWPGSVSLGQTAAPAPSEGRLQQFLVADWDYWMHEYPEMATSVGYPGQNDRWTDDSTSAVERRTRHLRQNLQTLRSFNRSTLTAAERLDYDLYRSLLETTVEGLQYHFDALPIAQVIPRNLLMPMTQMSGPQLGIAEVIEIMPARNTGDYENILARLEKVPAAIGQTIAQMREGMRLGWTPPRITLRGVPGQIETLIAPDAGSSPVLGAFRNFPATVPEADRERLKQRAIAAYNEKFVSAFRKLHTFLADTYLPACREDISVSSLRANSAAGLPGGVEMYAYLVRWYTTTRMTPQQIHELGLAEVKRIRAEMDKVIASTGFTGSFGEFTNFLRTDPHFFFNDANALVESYRNIAKRADPQLAHLFGVLPRLTYGVKPVPEHSAPTQTTAYYQPGSLVAGRPGWYFVNTYNLPARPKWEMEALSLHEAVPGHHLQIALAQELENQPEFRKHAGFTAFVEGWGLYAESLGEEMDFYRDPYSKFGQLTYEMWRAMRLVVDTGMHSMGWSRQQAIEFFRANSAKTEQDITVEIDRYIVWPGQALGYKIGQLKIRELRTRAERELGPRFNVRAFHDAVLGQGALPLDLLESRMNTWIAQEKKKSTK